jgi:hypothetical protein
MARSQVAPPQTGFVATASAHSGRVTEGVNMTRQRGSVPGSRSTAASASPSPRGSPQTASRPA